MTLLGGLPMLVPVLECLYYLGGFFKHLQSLRLVLMQQLTAERFHTAYINVTSLLLK